MDLRWKMELEAKELSQCTTELFHLSAISASRKVISLQHVHGWLKGRPAQRPLLLHQPQLQLPRLDRLIQFRRVKILNPPIHRNLPRFFVEGASFLWFLQNPHQYQYLQLQSSIQWTLAGTFLKFYQNLPQEFDVAEEEQLEKDFAVSPVKEKPACEASTPADSEESTDLDYSASGSTEDSTANTTNFSPAAAEQELEQLREESRDEIGSTPATPTSKKPTPETTDMEVEDLNAAIASLGGAPRSISMKSTVVGQ
jgi:hypothetical protein